MCWKNVLPFMNRLHTNNRIFQPDLAAIHTSKLSKDWFEINIEVLDWPTKSPDLNPIEICWEFCQEEYTKKRQFEDRETLKFCFKQYWNEIPSETLRKLIDSIRNKCVQVLQLKGNKCKHWILYNFAVEYKIVLNIYPHSKTCFFHHNVFWWKIVIKSNIYTNTHRI